MKRQIVLSLILLALVVSGLALPGGVQAAGLQAAGDVSVTPPSSAKSGLPGTSVSYSLAVTLDAATTGPQTITASLSPGSFGSSTIDIFSVTLNPGESVTFTVTVNIPAVATPGSSDTTTITFTGPGAPAVASLTTTVTPPTPTLVPTATRAPTLPPANTAIPFPPGSARPLVVVTSYYLDQDTIAVGDSFKLFIELRNDGTLDAKNLILSFLNESFLPQETGGVIALGTLGKGSDRDLAQRFLVSSALAGLGVGTIPVKLTYSDADGVAYSESFSITLQLRVYSGAALPTATPTQAQVFRPQIVIAGYQTDVDPLQPGTQFTLNIDASNLGNADARAVTLVLGGGVTPDASGTAQPGELTGGSGDLTNFAPVGSSNLVYLGDLPAGALTKATVRLIVNVTANPGAYTLKISFAYTDPKGNRLVDDQVITLLVYQLPSVDVNFYRDPGPLFAGQVNMLPLQVVNLGRKQAVLGNMTITAAGAEVQNNTSLVGPLDPGGFFTLDASIIPPQAGEMELQVLIKYTDDFSQARELVKTVKLNIQESAPVIDPGTGVDGGINGGGGVPAPVEETFWQKALRFFKGLIGLDSAPPQPNPLDVPIEGIPPTDGKPIQVPSGGKGG